MVRSWWEVGKKQKGLTYSFYLPENCAEDWHNGRESAINRALDGSNYPS